MFDASRYRNQSIYKGFRSRSDDIKEFLVSFGRRVDEFEVRTDEFKKLRIEFEAYLDEFAEHLDEFTELENDFKKLLEEFKATTGIPSRQIRDELSERVRVHDGCIAEFEAHQEEFQLHAEVYTGILDEFKVCCEEFEFDVNVYIGLLGEFPELVSGRGSNALSKNKGGDVEHRTAAPRRLSELLDECVKIPVEESTNTSVPAKPKHEYVKVLVKESANASVPAKLKHKQVLVAESIIKSDTYKRRRSPSPEVSDEWGKGTSKLKISKSQRRVWTDDEELWIELYLHLIIVLSIKTSTLFKLPSMLHLFFEFNGLFGSKSKSFLAPTFKAFRSRISADPSSHMNRPLKDLFIAVFPGISDDNSSDSTALLRPDGDEVVVCPGITEELLETYKQRRQKLLDKLARADHETNDAEDTLLYHLDKHITDIGTPGLYLVGPALNDSEPAGSWQKFIFELASEANWHTPQESLNWIG